jgi:hypothetical protein
MPGPRLTLYVDTVSPFAYEAYYILRVSARHDSSRSSQPSQLNDLCSILSGREDCYFQEVWTLGGSRTLIRSSLQNDPVFKKCEIVYVPIFLGGVMKACGNTPPIKVKSTVHSKLVLQHVDADAGLQHRQIKINGSMWSEFVGRASFLCNQSISLFHTPSSPFHWLGE